MNSTAVCNTFSSHFILTVCVMQVHNKYGFIYIYLFPTGGGGQRSTLFFFHFALQSYSTKVCEIFETYHNR